ncbi:MAG TPA: hypothetical protein VMF08_14875 [Candidatus Sulfotelmatobacter sp.]|nr:hypothetical protein [Candidatus Sulfotelmatobacter sp.]
MKIYKASEKEINERLELDKRKSSRGFGVCFDSLEEAPNGFYKTQDEIRNGLQKEFWLAFDNGAEHLRYKPWDSKFFYFNTDMFGSERMVVEISKAIFSDKLIGLILSYLEKCSSRYYVIASVYENLDKGSQYLGRFVINLNEIAVEESLAAIWSQQVKFMEIENLLGQ